MRCFGITDVLVGLELAFVELFLELLLLVFLYFLSVHLFNLLSVLFCLFEPESVLLD